MQESKEDRLNNETETGSNGNKETAKDTGLDFALDIVDLSKRFRRQTAKRSSYTTLKTSFLNSLFKREKLEGNYTVAIKDLTLRIPRGASVGIIGKNGSGKSTLLKLITGIYKPDRGNVSVNGRISALIELGAGFHPDFSGRENVYLGGVMHGLSRDQIDDRFEDIVKFAELSEVIDDPVRTYSSGMFMRLGFSLAIHTDPDVLLIDEVLAVGDAAFVSKCKDRIAELRSSGKTLLLVTHDLAAVRRWCDEALWLEKGQVMDRGDPERVIDGYRHFLERGEELELLEDNAVSAAVVQEEQKVESALPEENAKDSGRWGSREIEITTVRLCSPEGENRSVFRPGESLRIEIDYLVRESVEDVIFGIGINRNDGLLIHGTNTDIESITVPLPDSGSPGGAGKVSYEIKRLDLLDGTYFLDVAAHSSDEYPYDYHKGILSFAVRSPLKQIGVWSPEHNWRFE